MIWFDNDINYDLTFPSSPASSSSFSIPPFQEDNDPKDSSTSAETTWNEQKGKSIAF